MLTGGEGTPLAQIVVLPTNGRSQRARREFEVAMKAALNRLGAIKRDSVVFLEDTAAMDPKLPTVVVFFGFPNAPAVDPHLSELLAAGHVVIPVVQPGDARGQIPIALEDVKAVARLQGWAQQVAQATMVELALAPNQGAVFISYAHGEGRVVARQIEAALARQGTPVFLDERAVTAADPLRGKVHRGISASHVFVQLATPQAHTRPWMKFEEKTAARMCVGVVRICWPGVVRPSRAVASVALDLKDFHRRHPRSRLSSTALKSVVECIHTVWPRALAFRRARFERAIAIYARENDARAKRDALRRWVEISSRDGFRERCLPIIGMPTSEDLQAVSTLVDGTRQSALADYWAQPTEHLSHLMWLVARLDPKVTLHLFQGRKFWTT